MTYHESDMTVIFKVKADTSIFYIWLANHLKKSGKTDIFTGRFVALLSQSWMHIQESYQMHTDQFGFGPAY